MEVYFSNGLSVIEVQRTFRRHFDIPPRGRVPDQKCVLMSMDAFRATGNVSKERKGPPKTVRTPENVERVSTQTGDINWPEHSPDIFPDDYFLCPYLKSLVYKYHFKTLEDLRNNIRAEMDNIPVDMLETVTQRFRNRLYR
ncbi:DUF4817 domain-containing protein [Trichonephila clavipes]|nr:DUF4817 domain-containing protein [Trichonephila clavipes]